jgi:hypothetical protein
LCHNDAGQWTARWYRTTDYLHVTSEQAGRLRRFFRSQLQTPSDLTRSASDDQDT